MTNLATRTFPSRIADLDFSLALPSDWISHELPTEAPNFDDPTLLIALAVVTAPHSAIVLAVAARPAYTEGTLSDWGRWLLEKESASVRAMGEGQLGALPALVAEATKDSEVGTLVLRTAFAEDGARLINVTLTAPELLANAVLPIWNAALESFSLSTPRGATVPVYPSVEMLAQPSANESEQSAAVDEKPAPPEREKSPRAETKRERKQRRKRLTDPGAGPPGWWVAAEALEAQGKVEEAVELVGRESDLQGAIISQAELWARALHRRLEAGDREGAKHAWNKSRDYAYAYAASATSVGEGAALSRERDAFLEQLGPEPS
jgi:hypothetical protein